LVEFENLVLSLGFLHLFSESDLCLMSHLVSQMQLLDSVFKIFSGIGLLFFNLIVFNVQTAKLDIEVLKFLDGLIKLLL
jgi:hypothetical protein